RMIRTQDKKRSPTTMAVQDFTMVPFPLMTMFKFNFAVNDMDVDPDFAIPEEIACVWLSDTNTSEAHLKPK
ncbi:hypothetical protein, partial [Alkalibacillus haloalkaliphilus]|uniref:hypothetical protein n=1 Tax=Alkalibacillus haloalkaliphilus TaxID=94136 RepID=UPI002936420B